MVQGSEWQPQWVQAVVPIANALLAAVVAIAVTWMAHWFTARREEAKARLDQAEARKAFLRQKLELFVSLIDEHVNALHKHAMNVGSMGVHSAAGQAMPSVSEPDGPSALSRAEAIAGLYFPQLEADVQLVSAAYREHVDFTTKELGLIAIDAKNWASSARKDYGTRAGVALGNSIRARAGVVARASAIIREELAP